MAEPSHPATSCHIADTSPAKPRWTRRKDARPQEVLTAALDLFVEHGFAATRLEDVAARAGVSKGTVYLYFASKEELFKAVVRASILPLLDEAEEMVADFTGHTFELYRGIITGWWERMSADNRGGITKLVMAEARNFPELASFYHAEVIQRARAMLASVVRRGVARGEFRAVDAVAAGNVLSAPMLMLVLWQHSFGACGVAALDPRQYLDSFLDLSLRGLAAPPAQAQARSRSA